MQCEKSVGLEIGVESNGGDAVVRFAAEIDFRRGIQISLNSSPDEGVIINNQNPNHMRARTLPKRVARTGEPAVPVRSPPRTAGGEVEVIV
jgi:hypothetical protein